MTKDVKKILLVDDNPISQRMAFKMFQNDGYEVFLAWNEEECLRMAKSEKPHAIIMDIIFPDNDGRDIVKKIQKDPAIAHIPIVFGTNMLDCKDDKGDLSIQIGEVTYRAFAKPLHYPKLLNAVRKEINRGQRPISN